MELSNEIDKIFELQRSNKYELKNTDCSYRISKLKAFQRVMLEHKEEIEQALVDDFGKARLETTLTEIIPVVSMINETCKNLKKWMRPKKIKSSLLFFGTKNTVSYEAKGNCLVISPWNYPFQLAIYPILTSFSAGNTTILKPSEFTPSTNQIIKKLISLIFTPKEVSVVEGEIEASNLLLEKPFDHIFFTGSTPVGKIIMEKASKHLASVALELGGKSPVIIDKEFPLDKAVNNIVWGKHVNGGQTCVAPDYVFVHKTKLAQFIKLYKESITLLYNDSFEENSDYCRIITPRHGRRLEQMVEDSIKEGAKLEYGGKLYSNGKFQPTLLTGVNGKMKIMSEEIFGPILPIIEYDDLEEVINFINSNDNPLALYVYSYIRGFQEKIRSVTNSGGINFNESLLHVANPKLPFGGAGKSGIGKYHGHYGFEEMSNMRSVLNRKHESGLTYFNPPYLDFKQNIITRTLKWFKSHL